MEGGEKFSQMLRDSPEKGKGIEMRTEFIWGHELWRSPFGTLGSDKDIQINNLMKDGQSTGVDISPKVIYTWLMFIKRCSTSLTTGECHIDSIGIWGKNPGFIWNLFK